MRRGRTFNRGSSAGSVPVLRPVDIQAAAGSLLADAGRGDWVLCQITSSPYGDVSAIPLDAPDFAAGGLLVASFARPGKLFTASASLMVRSVGTLSPPALCRVLAAVVALFQPAQHP
jgi:mRNA interferase MazF